MGRAKLDGDDPLDVWSAALDGSDRRIVVSGLPVKVDYYSHVAPSPDGNELAYVHRDDNRVHVWRLDTGADLVVSSDSAFRAYWLDDTTLAYLDANDEATHIVNADGSEDRALFPFYVWGATHDGRVIVQSSYDQLSVVTRDGDVTPVTEQEAYVLSGVLAPDGAHMAWTEASGCRCPSTVVRIGRPDGTESSVLPNDGAGGQSYFGRNSPSWADDETLYSIRPEVAIDRTRLDGDTVDVISFGGGYWDFLGVR